MDNSIIFQFLDPEVIENPYPFYRELLAHAPVYQVPNTEVYLVSSPKLIHQVLKNQQDFSANLTGVLISDGSGQPTLFDFSQFGGTVDAIANADEPFHSVHRKLVMPQLTARKVMAMESQVRSWAGEALSQLLAQGGGDCIGGLANAIPVLVMARLMGLPIADLDKLLDWSFSGGDILAGTANLERMVELGASTAEMSHYLRGHFQRALQSDPSDTVDCVLNDLAQGVKEGLIDEEEAVAIAIVLVGAAGESTSSLVGSAIRILARDPDLQSRLRQSPELIESYIEEVVRLETPFKGHYRAVLHQTEIAGISVPAGAKVFLLWAAANRDETVFSNPEMIDLNRENKNEHLGFGHGIHFCIGARLARMETRIILEELLQRTKKFSLQSEHSEKHVSSIFVRRLQCLELRMSAA
ncbi:MAG: cytochrome P450 [Halieaceae bacterium]|jgi:cytochrome P450|nr:cytochrome P450 [Halieaceae bacterium]